MGGSILVGADTSHGSDEAIRQGSARARMVGSELVICHVLPDPLRVSPLLPMAAVLSEGTVERTKVETTLRERVANLTRRGQDEFRLYTLEGIAHATLIEEAERLGAELLVVGSQVGSGLVRTMLGSVAERVVRYAHCPVLVARPKSSSGRVLVATDFSVAALPAVRAAVDETKMLSGHLTAVHCLDLTGIEAMGEAIRAALAERTVGTLRAMARERLAAGLAQFGACGDVVALDGAPATEIVRLAAQLNTELVVVGTAGTTGLRRLVLGSVAEAVVRNAACSVLVIRLHHLG